MLAINSRTSLVTGISPFFATHGYDVNPIEIDEPLRTKGESPMAKGEAFLAKLREATEMAQTTIAIAQEKYEGYANRYRLLSERFNVGDKVWLSLKNIATDRPCKKLDWKNAKYTVKELVGSHAVRLDTPPGIHDVFHVMLLRKASTDPLPSQAVHEPQPLALASEEDEKVYLVEAILDYKHNKNRGIQLLIKWEGYTKPTWEPAVELAETDAYKLYAMENDLSKASDRPKRGKAGKTTLEKGEGR